MGTRLRPDFTAAEVAGKVAKMTVALFNHRSWHSVRPLVYSYVLLCTLMYVQRAQSGLKAGLRRSQLAIFTSLAR